MRPKQRFYQLLSLSAVMSKRQATLFSCLQTVLKRQRRSEEVDDDRELQDIAKNCPKECYFELRVTAPGLTEEFHADGVSSVRVAYCCTNQKNKKNN